jgi:hypothetical protein
MGLHVTVSTESECRKYRFSELVPGDLVFPSFESETLMLVIYGYQLVSVENPRRTWNFGPYPDVLNHHYIKARKGTKVTMEVK